MGTGIRHGGRTQTPEGPESSMIPLQSQFLRGNPSVQSTHPAFGRSSLTCPGSQYPAQTPFPPEAVTICECLLCARLFAASSTCIRCNRNIL